MIFLQRVMKRLQEQDKPKKEKEKPAPVQPPTPKPITRTQTQPIATRQMSEGKTTSHEISLYIALEPRSFNILIFDDKIR